MGVVICVGKKLTKMQSDLNAIAASLGADFRQGIHVWNKNIQGSSALTQLCDYPYLLGVRWVCDDSVTHYIYQGRVGDNSREYRGVKERGLHMVSQYWLHAVCFHVIIIMQVVEVQVFGWPTSCRAVCWGTEACSRVFVSIQLQPKNEPEP